MDIITVFWLSIRRNEKTAWSERSDPPPQNSFFSSTTTRYTDTSPHELRATTTGEVLSELLKRMRGLSMVFCKKDLVWC